MRRAAALATITLVAGLLGTASASASGHDATTPRAATQRVVVRPVDAHGHPAAGWSVHRQRGGSVQCDGAARAAVDDGVTECFPTAEYLPACWKSHHHTVLCLRDARTQNLVRVRYAGTVGSPAAPKHASPLDLALAGGQQCDIRLGGAWGTLPSHPRWVGFYSCDHGSVYGRATGDGVIRHATAWKVHEWRSGTRSSVVKRRVATAYFVGTSR